MNQLYLFNYIEKFDSCDFTKKMNKFFIQQNISVLKKAFR
jgi:hypothetical protein